MLYLGIDQHRKQLTVNLRNESGDVVLRRQVSTRWTAVRAFFADLAERSESQGGYVAILEVCGFNYWLLTLLEQSRCRRVLLIQVEERAKRKTDRRDANRLCEMLWLNRERLLAGKKVQQLRVVQPASPCDERARQVTALWRRVTKHRKHLLHDDDATRSEGGGHLHVDEQDGLDDAQYGVTSSVVTGVGFGSGILPLLASGVRDRLVSLLYRGKRAG